MTIIIAIAVLLAVGAFLLLRASSAPAPPAPAMGDQDKVALREAVLARLQDRLVGWTFDAPPDHPLELSAQEAGTDRRIQMNLDGLADEWFPLHTAHRFTEADDVIDAFAAGVSGQEEGTDEEADPAGLHAMLALWLVAPGQAPPDALTRPAGPTVAVLVVRRPGGPEPVTADALAALKLTESEAFAKALDNLAQDVEEGVVFEPLDAAKPPDAIAIAPDDPLAASYALVPGLASRIRKSLGDRDGHLYVDADSLVAAVDGVEIERGTALVPDAAPLDGLAWRAPAA